MGDQDQIPGVLVEADPPKPGVIRGIFTGDDLKFVWAGTIALIALLCLATTTVISMFHWPIDNGEMLRTSNTLFSNVVSMVLGAFLGASVPPAAKQLIKQLGTKPE